MRCSLQPGHGACRPGAGRVRTRAANDRAAEIALPVGLGEPELALEVGAQEPRIVAFVGPEEYVREALDSDALEPECLEYVGQCQRVESSFGRSVKATSARPCHAERS